MMRIWEVEDNRAGPADLVREQDLIMRVRRLHRLGTPHIVINLILSATDDETGQRGTLELAQKRLRDWAQAKNIHFAELSNGDVFLIRDGTANFLSEALSLAWPAGLTDPMIASLHKIYALPKEYDPLRERLNDYVEDTRARANAAAEGEGAAGQILHSDAARGPLTAWSVDQIERLLGEIDISRYIRSQSVCEHQPDGTWRALFDECFIGFEALQRDNFPKLDMGASPHLFLALCQALDQHLLAQIAANADRLIDKRLFLNLSVASIIDRFFSQFAWAIPVARRHQIGFELHRGDLLQDWSATLNAFKLLHDEGFRIAIDSVTPDMLPYLNLHLLPVDYIKLNVAKDRVHQLEDKNVLAALALIEYDKLIFYRCDSEPALLAGLKLGVKKFQGWLIDAQLEKQRGA